MTDRRQHWQSVYDRLRWSETSWYQDASLTSLRLVERARLAPDDAIIDVGGGGSAFARDLLDAGCTNVTVLDISSSAIAAGKDRLGDRAARVSWMLGDLFDAELPAERYALWHDRAFFHFLTEAAQRARYRATLDHALRPGGYVILATFAADGPAKCSGLDVVRYSADDLVAEMGATFQLLASEREEHRTPSGGVQPFTFCLFRQSPKLN
jgi:SAM-dependent methyltransferase